MGKTSKRLKQGKQKAAAALRLPSCSCCKYVAKISGAYLPQPLATQPLATQPSPPSHHHRMPQPLATQPSQPPRALCVGNNPCYAVERQELVAQALGWRLGRAPIHGGADILICEGGLVGLQQQEATGGACRRGWGGASSTRVAEGYRVRRPPCSYTVPCGA